MKKILTPFLVAIIIVFTSCSAFAATLSLKVDSLAFNSEDKKDVMGAGSSQTADGKPDASFTLALSGAQAIKAIILKNETTGKVWSTNPSGTAELLLVKDSGGSTLNASGRLPIIPVLLGADFMLYINDAQNAIPKDSSFAVAVKLIDNSEATGKVAVKGLAQPAAPAASTTTTATTAASGTEGITFLESNGIGEYDFAGRGEKVGSDGKEDFQFALKLNFADATIKGLRLSAASKAGKADWDTIPGNKLPIITVVDANGNILNRVDGNVTFQLKGAASYILLVQDIDGVLSASNMTAKLRISLSDGRMYEKEAAKGKTAAAKDSLSVEYKGTGKYDFVSSGSEKIESNLNPDRQINAVLDASGTVTGVRVKCTKSGKIWDTVAGNKNPLVLVTNGKGERQNKADGVIALAVNGSTDLSLWIDEEDDNLSGPYQVTFVLSNGQVLEASTAPKTAASTPAATAKPNAPAAAESTITKEDRAAAFISVKPAVVNFDLVGKNKKRGASGAKDTALNVQIVGKGIITNMVLVNAAGKGWDTIPGNNGRWLLGVREGSKFLNTPEGRVRFPVNGIKRYQLLMQDNGTLAAKKGTIFLTLTWGDGEVTETKLAW